jgi:hypothetical protein
MTRSARLAVPVLLVALAAGCSKEQLCSSDLTLCDGACTALSTDPANCGACGAVCGDGKSCSDGQCFCPWPDTCGDACADLASDPAHCGACDVACAGSLLCSTNDAGMTSCVAGACAGSEQTACGRACVNLQTHRANCGACGRACGSNERCEAGRCIADLYLACYNSDEVREATGSLVAAGIPRPVAPGPIGLAWAGDRLAVASARPGGAETLALVRFDPPRVRRADVLETSVATPDVQYLAEHAGLLYLAHSSLGTLLVVTPGGRVVDEVRLAPTGAPNPNPQGVAFANDKAYVALNERNEVAVLDVSRAPACAAGAAAPPCTSEVARLNVQPLASPGAFARPSRVAISGGRAFVTLWNLDALWNPPAGSSGRLAAIAVATDELDTAFAGTASGLIDLGPGCLNPADVAESGGKLFVTCGAFDYSAYPLVTIRGSGIVPVDVSGPVANVLPIVAASSSQAPGKLAFCGSAGYVGDRNSGRVFPFDPAAASTILGPGVELCPPSNDFAYVADIACGR